MCSLGLKIVGMKILVCEDNEIVNLAYQSMLADSQLTTCVTGKACVEASHHARFDLLILDIGLPDMDGLDVALELLPDQEKLVIVIVSGHSKGNLCQEKMTKIREHPNCLALEYIVKTECMEKLPVFYEKVKIWIANGKEGEAPNA